MPAQEVKAKRTASQRGRSNRRKGQQWEREVAEAFRAIFVEARRGIGQARSASEVADVEVPYFWVECKVGARTNAKAALAQATKAKAAKHSQKMALAVCKDDRCTPMVAMYLPDFMFLAAAYHNMQLYLQHTLDAQR